MNLRGSYVEIGLSLVSSGLIVTLFGIMIHEISKPHINILVEPLPVCQYNQTLKENLCDESDCHDNWETTPCYKRTTLSNTITNDLDRSAAKNVRITLYYPHTKILSYNVGYSNENISIKNESNNLLYATIPRLSSGASVIINVTIDKHIDKGFHLYRGDSGLIPGPIMGKSITLNTYFNDSVQDKYDTSVTYDEGSKHFSLPTKFSNNLLYGGTQVAIVCTTIALITLIIALIGNRRLSQTRNSLRYIQYIWRY